MQKNTGGLRSNAKLGDALKKLNSIKKSDFMYDVLVPKTVEETKLVPVKEVKDFVQVSYRRNQYEADVAVAKKKVSNAISDKVANDNKLAAMLLQQAKANKVLEDAENSYKTTSRLASHAQAEWQKATKEIFYKELKLSGIKAENYTHLVEVRKKVGRSGGFLGFCGKDRWETFLEPQVDWKAFSDAKSAAEYDLEVALNYATQEQRQANLYETNLNRIRQEIKQAKNALCKENDLVKSQKANIELLQIRVNNAKKELNAIDINKYKYTENIQKVVEVNKLVTTTKLEHVKELRFDEAAYKKALTGGQENFQQITQETTAQALLAKYELGMLGEYNE